MSVVWFFCVFFFGLGEALVIVSTVTNVPGRFMSKVGPSFRYAPHVNRTFHVFVEDTGAGDADGVVGVLMLCSLADYRTWQNDFTERELSCELGARFPPLCFAAQRVVLSRSAPLNATLLEGTLLTAAAASTTTTTINTTANSTVVTPVAETDHPVVTVVMQRCMQAPAFSLRITAVLMNGDSHLDVEDLHVPTMFLGVSSVYGVLVLFWFVYWRWHGFQLVWMNALLTAALVCKSVALAVALWHWSAQERVGDRSLFDVTVLLVVLLIQRAVQFALLFLLAKGFGVSRRSLERSEMRAIALMTAIVAGALLAFDIDDKGIIGDFVSFARLSSKGVGFVAALISLAYVRVDFRHVISVLGLHVLFSRADGGTRTELVLSRLSLMYGLRLVIFVFFGLMVVAHLVILLSLNELEWFERLICEVVDCLLFVSLMWLLRLRSERPRRQRKADNDDQSDERAALAEVEPADVALFVLQLPPHVDEQTRHASPHIVVASRGRLEDNLSKKR